MKLKRIIRRRDRGWLRLDERAYFKSFQAFDSYVSHPDVFTGWKIRTLQDLGVI